MHDKYHVIPAAFSVAGTVTALSVVSLVVQILAGIGALIATGITIYKFVKERKEK